MSDEVEGGVTRSSFIKASAGVAAGAAAFAVPAANALSDESPRLVTGALAATPSEPVMAFVRDAARGEVTVMAGTSESTYRDPTLVKRLLAIAPQSSEEGSDVVAP